jgi:hypothetical protein
MIQRNFCAAVPAVLQQQSYLFPACFQRSTRLTCCLLIYCISVFLANRFA